MILRPRAWTLSATVLLLWLGSAEATPITETVDPSNPADFATVAAAAAAETAGNTYTINVAPGTYVNDFPVINQPTSILAVTPGTVTLSATATNDQGIIETFAPLTVNGLTITGAMASAGNGSAAAIRDHNNGGGSLVVTNSIIENSQDGILTSSNSGNTYLETVTISNDTFIGDGGPIGPAHAVYIGDALSAIISNSLFCGTVAGHDIKSRAASTTVTSSTLFVGTNAGAPAGCGVGSASLAIDLPNGGFGVIDGNTIIQGSANQNGALIDYGEEGLITPGTNSLDVSNTTFDNVNPGVGNPTIGINELEGCVAPVSGTSTDTFTNIATTVNPANCIAAPTSTPTPAPASVPEPGSVAVLGSGLMLLGLMRWRWR